jgi:hypothetical protein
MKMIKISKEEWNKIPNDYKSKWTESDFAWRNDIPKEYLGKRTMMNDKSQLLTEGFQFEIVD